MEIRKSSTVLYMAYLCSSGYISRLASKGILFQSVYGRIESGFYVNEILHIARCGYFEGNVEIHVGEGISIKSEEWKKMKLGDSYKLPCGHHGEVVAIFENGRIAVKGSPTNRCTQCSKKGEGDKSPTVLIIQLEEWENGFNRSMVELKVVRFVSLFSMVFVIYWKAMYHIFPWFCITLYV